MKPTISGRPKKNSTKDLLSRLTDMAPPSFFSTASEIPSTSCTHIDIQCTICAGTLDRPIELGCGNLVCLVCITKYLSGGSEGCPCCYIHHLQGHTSTPSKVTMAVLGGQLVECMRGCNRTVRADHLHQHLQSGSTNILLSLHHEQLPRKGQTNPHNAHREKSSSQPH